MIEMYYCSDNFFLDVLGLLVFSVNFLIIPQHCFCIQWELCCLVEISHLIHIPPVQSETMIRIKLRFHRNRTSFLCKKLRGRLYHAPHNFVHLCACVCVCVHPSGVCTCVYADIKTVFKISF